MEKLATLIPMELIEQEAQTQIYNILALPFLKKLAIMPDVHKGYTLPIGGVALFDNVISPECVGVDIGCGMSCLIVDIKATEVSDRYKEKLFNRILREIPVGFSEHEEGKEYHEWHSEDRNLKKRIANKLYTQLGTLGGGNHFIELGTTTEGKLAITIHSGSRGVGNIVAQHYISLSRQVDKDLPNGFLHLDSDVGIQYVQDMRFFTQYALDNRLHMMNALRRIIGIKKSDELLFINENHNFADINGDEVRHRKGATPAEEGQYGVIPANMKDGVFITKGLGNKDYLESASHGAGRRFSRTAAKDSITLEQFKRMMSGVHAIVTKDTIDENPKAYKDINEVLAAQEGVNITVVDKIVPFINVKGG